MANDGKIYITISDSRFGRNKAEADEQQNLDNEKDKKDNTLQKFLQHKFFNVIQSQAKQAVNYTVSNIGNFTGNYQTQRDVQQSLEILNWVTGTATAAYTVAKSGGGWVGALVTVAVSAGSGLISAGYREYSEQFQNKKTNRNIEMMRNRLGLQGLTDGSRTGGY